MHQQFTRSFDSLQQIFAFIRQFCESEGVAAEHQKDIDFAIEEIFTNMVKYNPESSREIRIQLERQDRWAQVTLTDFDVEPFDPTQAPEVAVDAPLEQRSPGGLGLHLTQKLFDSMEYDYTDRTSTITLKKNLEVV